MKRTCSECRNLFPTEGLVEFRDAMHGFARVCERCWGKAGRARGWTLLPPLSLFDAQEGTPAHQFDTVEHLKRTRARKDG